MKYYYVDFGTLTIDEETKNKIETNKDYLKKWISEVIVEYPPIKI